MQLATQIERIQEAESAAKSIQHDMTLLDAELTAVKKLESEIEKIKTRLSGTDTALTMDDVTAARDALKDRRCVRQVSVNSAGLKYFLMCLVLLKLTL